MWIGGYALLMLIPFSLAGYALMKAGIIPKFKKKRTGIVDKFKYLDGTVPEGYFCADCGITGVRLYREYNTFLEHQHLSCRACTLIEEQDETDELYGSAEHTIGWKVAAVPTEDGSTYWGYTSVPQDGVDWWDNLPKTR